MSCDFRDISISRVQDIMHTAHSLKEATATFYPPSQFPFNTCNDSLAMNDLINLPIPQPLLFSLLEAGVAHGIATAASGIYQSRAEELRQHIYESIAVAWRKFAELPRAASVPFPNQLATKVVSTATKVYLHRLDEWKEDIVQRVKQRSVTPPKVIRKNNRAFNHEYVPLLELFFEENPFPTHADKVFLARKSNMGYRQIHVWFQNRRSRTKKGGKTYRKNLTYEGARKPLDKLRDRMEGRVIDSDPQSLELTKVDLLEGTTEDAISSSFPSHAFPSSYPPLCHYDPFPCKSGPVYFSKPEWRRVPNGKHPLPLSTSIDDLVERFSRLNVRDMTRTKGSPKAQSHAATVSITVVPSRAPHPSLIISKHQPMNIVQLRPLVRASFSASKAFESPSPTSKPVTLLPLSATPEFPQNRKIVPLPRRFAGGMRNTGRNTTHSESSSTGCPSRLFSIDSENPSPLLGASPMSTPSETASIQEQLHLFRPPCRSSFNSPIRLRGLDDIVSISPTSVA